MAIHKAGNQERNPGIGNSGIFPRLARFVCADVTIPRWAIVVFLIAVLTTGHAVDHTATNGTRSAGEGWMSNDALKFHQERVTADIKGFDASLRERLIDEIWRAGVPKLQYNVSHNVDDKILPLVQAVGSVDRLTIELPHDFISVVRVIRPVGERNRRLMVVHQGHGGIGANRVDDAILKFVAAGFDVLYCGMPLIGENTGPLPTAGVCGHDKMGDVETDTFNPLQLYFDHIPVGLKYARNTYGPYEDVSMCGISGGAWTTTIYSALDPSIANSFSIAGMIPHFLLSNPDPNWEASTRRRVYDICPVHLMYLLACSDGRSHFAMFNSHEPGSPVSDGKHVAFHRPIALAAKKMGGHFSVVTDRHSYQHQFTNYHFDFILSVLGGADTEIY